jgi:hypothetical protein
MFECVYIFLLQCCFIEIMAWAVGFSTSHFP